MFEFLFSYPASVWRDATLIFDSGWSIGALVVAIALAALVVIVSLMRLPLTPGRLVIVGALQVCLFAVLLTMLWRPALLVQGAEKSENAVAWLVDSSASMGIADVPAARDSNDRQMRRFDAGTRIIDSLALRDDAQFQASLYALGSDLQSVDTLKAYNDLSLAPRSMLATGLDDLLSTISQTSLAAVVLISDGSDNSRQADTQWWQRLAAAGVPVHTIGVGRLVIPDDLQLSDVILPGSAVPDATINARLNLTYGTGGPVRVRVFSGEQLLVAEDFVLPESSRNTEIELTVPTGDAGIRQLEFTVEAQNEATFAGLAADPEPRNNRQRRVVVVADSPYRVLYVEGEPRWEYKFLRRAIAGQPGVQIVSLLRTSANKFYRQGVRDASELAEGFPDTREALFEYDAVIIGSLEAAELSTAQQAALRDFVSIRGGSLLMLGGRHGLADGGWGRSVVAAALPVLLDNNLDARTFERARAYARPTLSGYRTPWLQLADTDELNFKAWNDLPALADYQRLGQVKPGAVVLLETAISSGPESTAEHTERSSAVQSAFTASTMAPDGAAPLLVSQRYGRGHSLVMASSGTWRWQMSMPSEDMTHERFWRQLVAMLVDNVLPQIEVNSSDRIYRDADTANLTVNAFNPDFSPARDAFIPVVLTLPDGREQNFELPADPRETGVYSADIPTGMDGPYAVTATMQTGGESAPGQVVSNQHWWIHESDSAESFDTGQQLDFLQRVAEVTGGSYLPVSDSDQLLDMLDRQNAALTRELRLPLWSMPIFFLILFAAKATEWLLRLRWKRL